MFGRSIINGIAIAVRNGVIDGELLNATTMDRRSE
jgi:hypothetical protein